MKKFLFGSYLNVLLFLTATVLIGSVIFTLITGVSPFEALNVSPLAATILFVAVVLSLVALPYVIKRIRGN
jgi:hypothetical protein